MADSILKQIETTKSKHRASAGKHVIPEVISREDITDGALEVIEVFGINCADTLNNNACALEDQSIESVNTVSVQKIKIFADAYALHRNEIQSLKSARETNVTT